jgi:hypothetical protein
MTRRLLSLLALAALGGCGGATPSPPAPTDPTLSQTQRLARLAYDQDRPDQAATLYRQALDRAWRRDDLQAIGDAGYNLAIVELRRGDPVSALDVARSTQAELLRRGAGVPADLQLVEAVALYRSGDGAASAELAATVVGRADASVETVARANFLTGLIADERGDTDTLAAVLAALAEPADSATEADRDELAGRLALRQGNPAAARAAFERAADTRRNLLDDRGMARALSLAGTAAEAEGETAAAADFYLRAGRTAALSGDGTDANRWLARAGQLARQTASASIAREADFWLDRLDKSGKS